MATNALRVFFGLEWDAGWWCGQKSTRGLSPPPTGAIRSCEAELLRLPGCWYASLTS